MKKINLLTILAFLLNISVYGQGELDAVRFSRNDLFGTAHGQAMGGAFGALGGDMTGVAINPAGIGIYRASEWSGTLGLNTATTRSAWPTLSATDRSNTRLDLDQFSYAGYYEIKDSPVKALNFGLAYNKLKDFYRDYTVEGTGMANSLTNYIAAITDRTSQNVLNGNNPYKFNNWLSVLGWNGYLINSKGGQSDQYESYFPQGLVNPKLQVREEGYISSYDFTVGVNIDHTFYIGMSLDVTNLYYRMESAYREDFQDYGKHYTLNNWLQTDGTGAQVNLGVIWRPTDALRLGLAYHSPSWYAMTDSYQAHVIPSYAEKNDAQWTPDDAHTDYNFQTPGSWVASVAGILGSKALVSVDYEIKDYSRMHLSNPNGQPYTESNRFIKADFQTASTVRAGVEYRFSPRFAGRVGAAWMQSPYKSDFKDNRPQDADVVGTVPHYTLEGDATYLTAGIGYKFTPEFYMDVAFVYKSQTDDLYTFPSIFKDDNGQILPAAASLKNRAYKGLLTFGYKF